MYVRYVCAHACVQSCGGLRLTLGAKCFPPYLLSLGLAALASLASQLALGFPCLHLVSLEYRQTVVSSGFHTGREDPNSGPHDHTTSTVSLSHLLGLSAPQCGSRA